MMIQLPDTEDFEVTEYAVKRREACESGSLRVLDISCNKAA